MKKLNFQEVRWFVQGQILTQVVWSQCLYSSPLYCLTATKRKGKIKKGAGLKAEKIISIFSREIKHESSAHIAETPDEDFVQDYKLLKPL